MNTYGKYSHEICEICHDQIATTTHNGDPACLTCASLEYRCSRYQIKEAMPILDLRFTSVTANNYRGIINANII